MFKTPRRWPLRSGFFLLLLAFLWGYVIPYQAGVRLDKGLAEWASLYPDWQLVRLSQSPYQRDFALIARTPQDAFSPRLLIRLYTPPPGWPWPKIPDETHGWHLGWARFEVRTAPDSPVQIYPLPRPPQAPALHLTGDIDWQGQISMAIAGGQSGGELRIRPDKNAIQGHWDIAGFSVALGTEHYFFGRTALDLNLQALGKATAGNGGLSSANLSGTLGLDIRRIGWVADAQRGSLSQLQCQLRQTAFAAQNTANQLRKINLFAALDTLTVNQIPWGGGQLAVSIDGAEPDFLRHLTTLIFDARRALVQQGLTAQAPQANQLLALHHALPQDSLPALLVALRSVNLRLSTLNWHSAQGELDLTGEAQGPRFAPPAPSTIAANPAPLSWQVHARLVQTSPHMTEPAIPTQFSYSAEGWLINGHAVDSSAIFP